MGCRTSARPPTASTVAAASPGTVRDTRWPPASSSPRSPAAARTRMPISSIRSAIRGSAPDEGHLDLVEADGLARALLGVPVGPFDPGRLDHRADLVIRRAAAD